tara:strand:+ start:366 stop:2324 length:1959 start_codon:yes stop_codon:yes gene_type:complete
MAPKQTLSQGLINQLVPRSGLGKDFTTKFNQLRDDQQEALNILGFKDYTGALGSGDAETFLGKEALIGAESLMNIPSAFGKIYQGVSLPFQAGEAGVTALLKSLVDPLQTQKGREKSAEKIAVGTSGLELGLPIDTTVPRGQLGPNPVLGQTIQEREAIKKKALLDKLRKSEKLADEFAGTVKEDTKSKDVTQDLPGEFAAEQDEIKRAKKAQDQKDAMETAGDEDLDYTDTYTEAELQAVNDPEVKKKAAQSQLFTDAMKDIEDRFGDDGEPKKRKTIDDYKADFARATGIDISGEPDNRSALMALGLSLMQNRAGKGFKLSTILGEVGRVGEAALPKFEQARKEARAGQVAAGKFALQEEKADRKAELALAKEKRNALASVSKEFREYGQKQQLEQMKLNNDLLIKRLEFVNKGVDPKGKITEARLLNQPNLKINKGYVAGNNNIVFLNAQSEAKAHADAYRNVLEAKDSINQMEDLTRALANRGNASAVNIILQRGKRLLKPLGIGNDDYSKDFKLNKDESNISEEKQIEILQRRLISQYKKFLTKETGNGISEGDIIRLQELLGKISPFKPLEENLENFAQLRVIFDAPQRTLEGVFSEFGQRKNHMSDQSYNDTMKVINQAITIGTSGKYGATVGSDGTINIDLTKR